MKSKTKKKTAGSKGSEKKKPAGAPATSASVASSVASVPPVSSSHAAPRLRGRLEREEDERPSWQRQQERIAISQAYITGLPLSQRDVVMATASEPLQHRERGWE